MAMRKRRRLGEEQWEQREQQEEEQQCLKQRRLPSACSYCQVDGRGGVLPERPMMILRRPKLSCSYSYSHEGDHDLVVLLEIPGSGENLQHLPWRQEKNLEKTLDEEEKERRRRKILIRVLPLPEGALFISTYYWAIVLKQSP
jgi:hypothetical protein